MTSEGGPIHEPECPAREGPWVYAHARGGAEQAWVWYPRPFPRWRFGLVSLAAAAGTGARLVTLRGVRHT